MKSTGNRIQARREALGMSREALADKLETTRMRIWRIENGKSGLRTDELPLFAKALKTTVAELVA